MKSFRKMITIVMVLSIIMSIIPYVYATTFADVPTTHWAYNAINYVSDNGYMNGTSEYLFSPNMAITKAQIVTILYSVAGKPDVPLIQPYDDVLNTKYYYKAVCWAYYHSLSEIIQTDSTTFSPNDQVTRVRIALLLWNFAQVQGWTTNDVPSVSLTYYDIGTLSDTQKNALKWCKYHNIMVGSGGYFHPFSTLTRAEQAVIVYAVDRFVAQAKAFCVGTNYGNGNIDTSDDAIYAGSSYEARGFTALCVSMPIVSIMRDKHNIKSQILFFSGHGTYDRMSFDYMQLGYPFKTGVCDENDWDEDGYYYVGINGNMDFVNLAVFAGCKTAEGEENITKSAKERGAKVTLGWNRNVYATPHTVWLSHFNYGIEIGFSILDAIEYADSFSYIQGSNVKSHTYYSRNDPEFNEYSSLTIINHSIQPFTRMLDSRNLLNGYNGNTNLEGEELVDEVLSILQEIIIDFDIENYNVNVYDQGNSLFTIDYIKRINGFETNSCFTATIFCNKLTALYDNTHDFDEDLDYRLHEISNRLSLRNQQEPELIIKINDGNFDLPENSSQELLTALHLAYEQTQTFEEKEAAEMKYHYYYDSEIDKACILVYTTYFYDNTETLGVDLYTYVIPE